MSSQATKRKWRFCMILPCHWLFSLFSSLYNCQRCKTDFRWCYPLYRLRLTLSWAKWSCSSQAPSKLQVHEQNKGCCCIFKPLGFSDFKYAAIDQQNIIKNMGANNKLWVKYHSCCKLSYISLSPPQQIF